MDAYNYLQLLKTINCMSHYEWKDALRVSQWPYPEEFESIWTTYKDRGLFMALCELDKGNLESLFESAKAKRTLAPYSSITPHR